MREDDAEYCERTSPVYYIRHIIIIIIISGSGQNADHVT